MPLPRESAAPEFAEPSDSPATLSHDTGIPDAESAALTATNESADTLPPAVVATGDIGDDPPAAEFPDPEAIPPAQAAEADDVADPADDTTTGRDASAGNGDKLPPDDGKLPTGGDEEGDSPEDIAWFNAHAAELGELEAALREALRQREGGDEPAADEADNPLLAGRADAAARVGAAALGDGAGQQAAAAGSGEDAAASDSAEDIAWAAAHAPELDMLEEALQAAQREARGAGDMGKLDVHSPPGSRAERGVDEQLRNGTEDASAAEDEAAAKEELEAGSPPADEAESAKDSGPETGESTNETPEEHVDKPFKTTVPVGDLAASRQLGHDRTLTWVTEGSPTMTQGLTVDPGIMRVAMERARISHLVLGFHREADTTYTQTGPSPYEIKYFGPEESRGAVVSFNREEQAARAVHTRRSGETSEQAWARQLSRALGAAVDRIANRAPNAANEDHEQTLPRMLARGLTHPRRTVTIGRLMNNTRWQPIQSPGPNSDS